MSAATGLQFCASRPVFLAPFDGTRDKFAMLIGLKLRGAPAYLASVTSAAEADVALKGGVDVIDAKDPTKGALGALDLSEIARIVEAVSGRAPVSATVGDLPSEAAVMCAAAMATAQTGADIVKVGFFDTSGAAAAIAALGTADLGSARLVAVLMADREPDLALIPAMARAGFAGVMLDTADKASGSLTEILGFGRLREFLSAVRETKMVAGLAGSLRAIDVQPLVRLQPDVLGFRGALCGRSRTSALEAGRVASIRAAIDAAAKSKSSEAELLKSLEGPLA